MIKEKLMMALKTAAADYNGGMGANLAVACAADAYDFNEKQTERLVEMFNTAAALRKQADSNDPTGTCELASKEAVAKILMDGCGEKKASAGVDLSAYSFYSGCPDRTNPTMEAMASGRAGMAKAASASVPEPPELDLSQRSLYKVISEKIQLLKDASDSADEVARHLRFEADRGIKKIAMAIEDPFADDGLADMFKAACEFKDVVAGVSECSTKVAESNGGRYAKSNVFDASPVGELLKVAEEVNDCLSSVAEYERKRDFYLSKAAEAKAEIEGAVGLRHVEKKASIADFFDGAAAAEHARGRKAAAPEPNGGDVSYAVKIAKMIRESGVSAGEVARLAEDLEKDAATLALTSPVPGLEDAHKAMTSQRGVDGEDLRIMNVRRAMILADLMTNDPIIRDADPRNITEAYKTMVMAAPRVSLDPSQVRAFLRAASNSNAISPSEAKVLTDVDKGIAYANVDKLTRLDSSIKDSNLS